jgi:hypothetical protein
MEDVGILYGYLVCFPAIWYILGPFGKIGGNLVYFSPILVCCTKKNLATLVHRDAISSVAAMCCKDSSYSFTIAPLTLTTFFYSFTIASQALTALFTVWPSAVFDLSPCRQYLTVCFSCFCSTAFPTGTQDFVRSDRRLICPNPTIIKILGKYFFMTVRSFFLHK